MSDPITAIARYLSADVRALGTLSQNVANLTTPGYRAVQRAESFGDALAASTRVDRRDGALMHTGRPLDLALQGPGFFQVGVGDRVFLTRNGQFELDAEGRLVDSQGRALLGASGPIVLAHDAVTIGEDGAIRDGNDVVDRIALVDAADDAQLQLLGNGLYTAAATTEATARVHQGALEGSNVDPGHEMVQLMQISRHASSVQHAITTYHTALVAGIDQIGKDS
jgi:flagellar basal body rod protein FlgG